MLLKMSGITILYIVLTFSLWILLKDRKLTVLEKLGLGIVYGTASVLSTHFGIDYSNMVLNVRDLGPLCAGLFFDPVSGIIAGLIGGIERYIAGTYWGIGSFTRVACSVSTCLAGFLAAFLNIYVFKGRKPSIVYSFFMGSVIEVFHMYVVFQTHRENMVMAFNVVRVCAVPMILFSGIGLAITSFLIKLKSGEMEHPFRRKPSKNIPVSERLSIRLFAVMILILVLNFTFIYSLQTDGAVQSAKQDIDVALKDISGAYYSLQNQGADTTRLQYHVGLTGTFAIVDKEGNLTAATAIDSNHTRQMVEIINSTNTRDFFNADIMGEESLCRIWNLMNNSRLIVQLPKSEIFQNRDMQSYETILANILLFTAVYMMITLLVQKIVVDNLELVNGSLQKITEGNLDEEVSVYSSSEFASLSGDINTMVDALKGYIAAAEKRIEEELLLAHRIQDSALPKNFEFDHSGFELYASMNPAKEVGGDFYDFFFVDAEKIALIIADVSGKGVPAALFMMKSKTAIRSLSETGNSLKEVFETVNNQLCEGNEAEMFVTAWMGVVNLETGAMSCINAGHEYPAIMRKDGEFELFNDPHRPPLGAMEDMKYVEYDLKLEKGDMLFVYTDGIPEAINESVVQYDTDRMIDALNKAKDGSVENLLKAVGKDVDDFAGKADQFDDQTMLGFRYLGKDS